MAWKYLTQVNQYQPDTYIWIDNRDLILTDTFTTDPKYIGYLSPVKVIGGSSTTIPFGQY